MPDIIEYNTFHPAAAEDNEEGTLLPPSSSGTTTSAGGEEEVETKMAAVLSPSKKIEDWVWSVVCRLGDDRRYRYFEE